jgi:hypothetical protein
LKPSGARRHAIWQGVTVCRDNSRVRESRILITFQLSAVFRRGNDMNWFYWNTAWSLFFSLVWFMTITHNPDAQISDAHSRDEAFGG